MPAANGIRVIRSSIHGYGVIATRDFAPTEVVAEADGVPWNDGDEVDDTYSLWISGDTYLDLVDQTRWINHSCAPNTEIHADLDEQGRAWARVVATRDIRAGEEITYDYGFPIELAEPCHCGLPSCRGLIVDARELEQPQRQSA